MKFREFQKIIDEYPLFTISELRLILGKKFNKTLQIQLKQWVGLNYLLKLRRSLYLLNRKDIVQGIDPAYLASKIYTPSYVSLEYALSSYGIIPEAVNIITSITTRKTATFKNYFGTYLYRHIKNKAFCGFKLKKYDFLSYQIATKEKALVDYFYLNQNKIVLTDKFWDSMRFNLDKSFSLENLKYYSQFFENKKLDKIVSDFIKYARSKFY